jgi:hypothetical protein
MLGQGRDPSSAIGGAPFHQAGASAAGNLDNLRHVVANAIQAYRLETLALGAIAAGMIGGK